jgi:diaminohydroxyphosphoribosylaminopyrimidine deaminase/5-amino-6-(5-phosphoribosylamino)uracil reductase
MRRALDLAAATRPHPNPQVAAIVIDGDGAALGEGVHSGPGMPHAETIALEKAGAKAGGATMVVTLEPCTHHGRTPPCVEAIIAAGISRVIVGASDPDSRISGSGIEGLRSAGIDVTSGVLGDEVEAADPAYFHHRRTGRSLVTVKAAMTLDGQTAAADGTSQWITSDEARLDAHRLRAQADAVIVGAGTVIADDPRLTVRIDPFDSAQPIPVVVAGSRSLPPDAAIFGRKALVYAPGPCDVPAEVIEMPGPGGVDLEGMVDDLESRGLLALLVEGGAGLAGGMLRSGLVDRGSIYMGGMIAGGVARGVFAGPFSTLDDARRARIEQVHRLGPDLRVDVTMGAT